VPLLTFSQGAPGTLQVAQSRFFLSPAPAGKPQSWTVPVCVNGRDCTVVTSAQATVPAGSTAFANGDGVGYYRSEYSPELLRKVLAEAPSYKAPERILLVGDRLALMRAGSSGVGDFMNLVAALRNDTTAQVLTQLLSGVTTVEGKIADAAQDKQLDAWMIKTFGPVYASLGPLKSGESEAEVERRQQLFTMLGTAGDPAVVAEARANVKHILAHDGQVNPQFVRPSVGIAAIYGDAALWETLQQHAETATDPESRVNSLYTLAYFSDPALATRTLDYTVSGKVKNQDSWILMSIMLQRSATRDLTWKYMKANWDKVAAQFTESSGGSVVGATGNFCSVADRDDVEQFFATHKVAASDRALKRAVQTIDACFTLRKTQGPKLAEWLSKQ